MCAGFRGVLIPVRIEAYAPLAHGLYYLLSCYQPYAALRFFILRPCMPRAVSAPFRTILPHASCHGRRGRWDDWHAANKRLATLSWWCGFG